MPITQGLLDGLLITQGYALGVPQEPEVDVRGFVNGSVRMRRGVGGAVTILHGSGGDVRVRRGVSGTIEIE